jgi:SAM-dependent methyltransferase
MSRLTRLRRLKSPTVAYEIQKNLRSRWRMGRGTPRAITALGATLGEPAGRVAYSRNVVESILAHARLGLEEVKGLRVLELGPGEDLGVALRFLAAGAAEVACIDRFEFEAEPEWEHEVYRGLLADLDAEQRARLEGMVSPAGELDRGDGSRLETVRGVGIEEGAARLGERRFDLIVSVAVLEHVYDLAAAFSAMDALLAPGGLMLHQVDLRDHGMFSGGGRHPLEFLTIPPAVYRAMTSHTGAPNRERIGSYRTLLAELGHDATIAVMNVGGAREDLVPPTERLVVGHDLAPELAASIEGMRARLAPQFADLPVWELAATGITIRSQKPAG